MVAPINNSPEPFFPRDEISSNEENKSNSSEDVDKLWKDVKERFDAFINKKTP